MSKRIEFAEYGGPEVLRWAEDLLAEPGHGQIRVRNELIGVNPIDWKMTAGHFGDTLTLPGVPGWASTGTVDAVGEGVNDFSVGDAVIAGARGGSYRELLIIDARLVAHRPPTVSTEQAAGLPSSGVAGYSLIHHLGITDADTLLVHGAAGSVGSAAVQIAIARGARVIGTASPANHDYLRSIGAIPIYYKNGLVEAVKATGIITASADAVGGQRSVQAAAELLPSPSRAVTAWGDEFSYAAGIPWVEHPADELERTVELAATGELIVRIAQTLPLVEAATAFTLSMTAHAPGKILLRV
ncbi:NADP-dependent oxidoreductase [Glutamicibacter mishrai]|uniref:NADP-dependent oxidoreductase n=1 Tax=Glutamicibacter mishrai TaxID=1775880 RepID=UPI0020CDFBB4|nr:NADP-dependent oxidoreductase [Glutamicibacter mishrai]UTT38671.1 NADP-dependent oxidoreductase [Glutamicibacter mishrai]